MNPLPRTTKRPAQEPPLVSVGDEQAHLASVVNKEALQLNYHLVDTNCILG